MDGLRGDQKVVIFLKAKSTYLNISTDWALFVDCVVPREDKRQKEKRQGKAVAEGESLAPLSLIATREMYGWKVRRSSQKPSKLK
jgi:hypothetical protein